MSRRTDAICGFIAGVFPFFTLAQYYAYEARPYGLVLGWCGLALFCWQNIAEGRRRYLWLTGFGLSLLAALLTHVYAVYLIVPFAAVEIRSLLKREHPDWGVLCVIACTTVPVAVLVYLPLFHAFRTTVTPGFFAPSQQMLQGFLVSVFGPSIIVFLWMLVLSGLGGARRIRPASAMAVIPVREIWVAACFTGIPLLAFVGCRITHGPFVARYFLSTVAGVAILLGFAYSQCKGPARSAQALAGGLLLLMIADLGLTMHLVTSSHMPLLSEPSSGLLIDPNTSNPMQSFQTVADDKKGLDILVLPNLVYIYFFYYAPRSVVPHLFFAAPHADVLLGLYQKMAKWGSVPFQTTTFQSFVTQHERFLVYASSTGSDLEALQAIASGGFRLISAQRDGGGVMYEYSK